MKVIFNLVLILITFGLMAFKSSATENIGSSILLTRLAGRSGRDRRCLTETNLQAAALQLEGAPKSLANGVPAKESGSKLTKTSAPVSPTIESSEKKATTGNTGSPTQVKKTAPIMMAKEMTPTLNAGAPESSTILSLEKKAPAPIAVKTGSNTQIKKTAPILMAKEVSAVPAGGKKGSTTAATPTTRGNAGSTIKPKPKPKVPTPTKAKPAATRESTGTIPVAMIG